MTNIESKKKLSPATAWLFAFGSVGAAIALSYALSGLGQKASAAIYFAVVAAGAFASTYLTRARLGGAILAFVTSAALAAVAYYFLVDHMMRAAVTIASDAVSLGQQPTQSAQAGAMFGKTFGIFVAAMVFLETIIGGIGGAFAGAKARGQGGLAALGSLARSAS